MEMDDWFARFTGEIDGLPRGANEVLFGGNDQGGVGVVDVPCDALRAVCGGGFPQVVWGGDGPTGGFAPAGAPAAVGYAAQDGEVERTAGGARLAIGNDARRRRRIGWRAGGVQVGPEGFQDYGLGFSWVRRAAVGEEGLVVLPQAELGKDVASEGEAEFDEVLAPHSANAFQALGAEGVKQDRDCLGNGTGLAPASFDELQLVKDIGKSRAAAIKSAFLLAQRLSTQTDPDARRSTCRRRPRP
jgi:hypothetical protein